MSDPQGIPSFANFRNVTSGGISISHGITPDVATIYATPQPPPYPTTGRLEFSYDGRRVLLRDCLLDSPRFVTESSGKQMMILSIKDRRWKWSKFGRISGEYNIVEGDGTIRKTSERTPRELFKLCLDAMGETKFDTGDVDDNDRPYVKWDGNPSVAMQELAEFLGMRVVFNFVTDGVDIRKVGVGKQLPQNEDVISDSLDVNPQEIPDSLVLVGAKSLVDAFVELEEAIGEEPDGTIKPIDKLSYKPKGGWDRAMAPEFAEVAKKYRNLAKKCIWKWYRPKEPIKLPTSLVKIKTKPGAPKKVKIKTTNLKLHQILPLETHQGRTVHIGKEGVPKKFQVKERVPAMVFGEFYGGYQVLGPEAKEYDTPKGKLAKYEHGFNIDTARGIVMFTQPLFLFHDSTGAVSTTYDTATGKLAAAKLYLLTGYGVRHPDTNAWYREELVYTPKGRKLGTQPYYFYREDVRRVVYFKVTSAGMTTVDNIRDVEKQADFYLKQELRNFQLSLPGTREYAGIVPFPPDGAIQQVTISIEESGRTTTRLSRNREGLFTPVSYEEQLRLQRTRALIAEEARKKTERKPGE